MKAHFAKRPYCLSCRRQLKDEEVAVHEHQSHRVTHDYTFGGYGPVIEYEDGEIQLKKHEETRIEEEPHWEDE